MNARCRGALNHPECTAGVHYYNILRVKFVFMCDSDQGYIPQLDHPCYAVGDHAVVLERSKVEMLGSYFLGLINEVNETLQ